MDDKKRTPEIRTVGFFGELPASRRRFLESKLKRIEFEAGSSIIKKGRSGQFLGIVESGELFLENNQSQTQTLTTGGFFGSEMLRYGKPSEFTITSRTETAVWILDRSDWMAPSPPPLPRTINTGMTRLNKAVSTIILPIISLAMVIFILGPTLLEYANNSLPNFLVEAGRVDLAEKYLRLSIRLKPESARAYGDLGDFLVLQDKEQEAIETYQQAIALDEYLPWIHNNLGVLLLEDDTLDQAVYHLQVAINLSLENTNVYRNLGNAYYIQERWEAAANAYQRALDLDPNLMDTKAAWAGIILNENQLEEARLAWEEVLQANPRNQLALQGLGVVALLEDDPALAMMYLDAARYLNPDDPTMHLYIGMAMEALDRPVEAATEYQYVAENVSDPELITLADTLLQVIME
ncbi:MAG: tetratricopeptide repeat protein [Anaerolineales bacterium]|nr:tetratricopeptide repeat protein [Anaerolineales bacterium]